MNGGRNRANEFGGQIKRFAPSGTPVAQKHLRLRVRSLALRRAIVVSSRSMRTLRTRPRSLCCLSLRAVFFCFFGAPPRRVFPHQRRTKQPHFVRGRRRPSKARGEWRERAGYSFRTSPAVLMSRRVAVLGCLSLGLLALGAKSDSKSALAHIGPQLPARRLGVASDDGLIFRAELKAQPPCR